MRSNVYDNLGHNLRTIRSLMVKRENTLKKSQEHGENNLFTKAIAEDSAEINQLAKVVQAQFDILKKDFSSNKINQAVYRSHLSKIKEFLEEGDTPVNVPINVMEMIQEIKQNA